MSKLLIIQFKKTSFDFNLILKPIPILNQFETNF